MRTKKHFGTLLKAAVMTLWVIAFGTSTFAQSNAPHYAKVEAGWQWDTSTDGTAYIPVCWENPQGYSTEVSWVQSAIANSWESVANISFQGWGACNLKSRGLRIRIIDNRSSTKGAGKQLDGIKDGMDLNFTFKYLNPDCQVAGKRESCIKSLAIHEFGHALGFLDEDTDGKGNAACNDSGGSIGWKLSSSDRESVMNYCNPRWNGGGKLSLIDIKDIQSLYGAKIIHSQGVFTLSDSLDPLNQQIWENVVVDLFHESGSSVRQFFNVNLYAPTQARSWGFTKPGKYCYNVWTHTFHSNNLRINGYGQGCVTLKNGGKYSFDLVQLGVNPGGFLNLKIRDTANPSQIH